MRRAYWIIGIVAAIATYKWISENLIKISLMAALVWLFVASTIVGTIWLAKWAYRQ